MRALCGAIITAGALIGLGFCSLGIGTRYENFSMRGTDGEILWLKFRDLDTPLMVCLVVLLAAVLIGLAIAFVGLAYHHERRNREYQRELGRGTAPHTMGTGAPT
jgi:hypothetical protein